MGRIILVRHGQASLLDSDYDRLSPLGEEQARQTGRFIARTGMRPIAVASGSLKRQSDTAALCLSAAGLPDGECAIDPDFDEYLHQDLFGARFPDLSSHSAIAAHVAKQDDPRRAFQALFEEALADWLAPPPGRPGQSWAEFRDRCVAAAKRLARQCGPGETALAFTSGGVIAAIAQHALGVPDAHVPRLHNPLHNASITVLLTRGTDLGLGSFNAIGHLEDGGNRSLVTYR